MAKTSRKILFATVPADGHFSPLTGLAVRLREAGHEVRWYTATKYAEKLERLQIPLHPLRRAMDVSDKPDVLFPNRKKIKGEIAKLNHDLTNVFVLRGPEYFEDLREIRTEWAFEAVICDCAFTAASYLPEGLPSPRVPVIAIGVLPLIETSRDLYPMGLGLQPSTTFWGRRKQDVMRFLADRVLLGKPNRLTARLLRGYGIRMKGSNLCDDLVRNATLFLQIGTPGFEYPRSDLGRNIRFIGALLPHGWNRRTGQSGQSGHWQHEKLAKYSSVILATQGTVERDVTKLLVPVLEAYKDTEHLVVVTTGGTGTQELRERFPQENVVIEDFIPFGDIMPRARVYVTNGGYGGVMLSIHHDLPMVVAGVHEGKNEINARIDYFGIGKNLGTELPTPEQIREGVAAVLADPEYVRKIRVLKAEFAGYDAEALCEQYLEEVLDGTTR